ncbi:LacI family transcriptional regulator [Nonomuraea fuscirosea]|uniref:LacI family DNA-binding transcriptional regulator n=1 Tax=Nonomuraea fuscirosea TaxID=1291556 RepID=UPI002DDA2D7D|nr:LacI family DNA-binding transcriptional regulator [Nonomuraea fuscirosea]WSA57793.1 LacI family transcriptional regulator [Nonomuraea fuscirosea]
MAEAKATIYTVARAVGVSAQTVSRVLNGTGQVSEKTRAAVLAAIEAQGYRPNAVGRSLRASRTPMVGVLVADIGNPFYARLHRAIERRLSGSGYSLMLMNCDDDARIERRQLELLRSYRPTGLVIVPSVGSSLSAADLPAYGHVVSVSRVLDGLPVPAVVTDERESVRAAAEELIAHGHTELALISGPEQASTARAREEGFHEALARHPGRRGIVRHTDGTRAGAQAAAGELLGTRPGSAAMGPTATGPTAMGPTAMVGFNALVTEGIVSAIMAAGLRCPEDVSVVGFTDAGWMTLHRPPISVIDQPVEEMGALAGRLLLDLAAGESVAPGPRVVPSTLIRRGSVAAPAMKIAGPATQVDEPATQVTGPVTGPVTKTAAPDTNEERS